MYKNVVLVGFMGTGKTTVGREVAGQLGWAFADTDHYVEERAGRSIPQLFAEQGEASFRQLETQALQDLLRQEGQVVSTGGGAVLREENRRLMLQGGLVVALNASEPVIVERVRGDGNRPLLQGNVEERVRTLMETRRSAYGFAPLQIDTDLLDVARIAELIIRRLRP
ncbi:MAG: shikimate kinase [Paenibacillaceae bacterium]|nr:shikimate kinase [Paenibacillaceae bacterium]